MIKVCEACGNEIDNDFNYCRECDEIVEPVEEDEEDLTVQKGERKNEKNCIKFICWET